ncbi:UDP-4-amino-4,6-dideoxy-N-acetyl-beta-L-altrosamine transaminase [Variovorax paradoxus]|nr:UDP-4-amino-4,6-dideoxy-N-acetyl-beta-L-altrosamine transaminase [Variovorax paradoxus]MBT2300798.1 UDP-4-amino-4,6-dideoxy-N-acetyl-beta-L-altrosamine transaminase [Variovorax paradoxus]
MSHIPYGRQDVIADDVEAVTSVLQSDWLTQGPIVPRFERAMADACGASHAVAVNSATSALHIACLALGLGPGDWLWTSPITFLASANCALYCGARVDFVDIDPRTYNLSPDALARKLEQARTENRLPKIVVPVHLAGQSCDMAAIYALSREYGFSIIEDASHAVGGRYQNLPVGDCRFSDIAVFSFHPVKIITSAEGGMALTNDAQLAERMALFRSHGMTREPAQMSREPDGPWYYEQIELGFNYRMSELQAALGLSQTTRLHDYVRRRHELARRYDERLASLPLTTPRQHPDCYSGLHLYVVRVDATRRRAVFDALRAQDIGVNVHYIPLHTQPYYRRLGNASGTFPEAESYYAEAISLPMYATLTEGQQNRVIDVLGRALLA